MDSTKNNNTTNENSLFKMTTIDLVGPVEAQRKHILTRKLLFGNSNTTILAEQNIKPQIMNTLDWWERKLLSVISSNLSVKYIVKSNVDKDKKLSGDSITFMGLDHNVNAARESYSLLHHVIVQYTEQYIKNYSIDKGLRLIQISSALIDSYRSGFLRALNTHFNLIIQCKPIDMRNESKDPNWRHLPLFERVAHYEGYIDCGHFSKIRTSKKSLKFK